MNFFVTGNEVFKAGIDLKFVVPAGSHGANFSHDEQTLRQSFSIAQEIFSRVAHGKIDFVLIGLSPDTLFRDEKFSADNVEKNLQVLNDYIKLCVNGGAKPVAVLLPYAPSGRESCRENFLTPLRAVLSEFQKLYDLAVVDLFDSPLPEKYFKDNSHFISEGVKITSCAVHLALYGQKIFPFKDFSRMSYDYFNIVSYILTKKFFHSFLEKLFQSTIEKLRRKDKINIAFVTDHAATWCGDELYNLFTSERFEPTIFLCRSDESTLQDFHHDLEQFKARGLNVFGVSNLNEETPPQDLVIFLRPYEKYLSKNFRLDTLTPQTLFVYIHYGFETTTMNYYDLAIFRLAWKFFFDTESTRRLFDAECKIGLPRAYASGLPKMDSFFTAKKSSFTWKMIRPDAVKIIWAPHWSIDGAATNVPFYATFHHNYQFMYEFAKNHPETSWVVKPHPRLNQAAVDSGLFPSVSALEDYFRAWDDLPNAQVFTGAYYQDIFATSDGMIHDSNSFIAEYQFTHKPMIFLMRDNNPSFTELGKRILEVSYLVDGRDFEGIAALVQKVFIDGDDPLKNARQKVFDELLNYRRINGVSASEFIFKSIADELEAN